MSKIGSFKDHKFILLCMIAVFGAWIYYLNYVNIDPFNNDQYPLLLSYQALLDGDINFFDLWEKKGGHRFPAYQALFFLNFHFLGFSATLESIVSVLFYAVFCYYLIVLFAKGNFGKSSLYQAGFALTLLLLLCNSQAIRNSTYSLIAARLMNFAGFALLASWVYETIKRKSPSVDIAGWIKLIAGLVLFILLFGRGWGMAACAAMVVAVVFAAICNLLAGKKILARDYLGVLTLIFLTMTIYFWGFESSGKGFDLGKIADYYSTKLGSANLGVFSLSANKNETYSNLMFLFYGISAAWIAFFQLRKGLADKAAFIATFFIVFSIIACVMVSLSRYNISPNFPRHNFELSVGIIGIFYFIFGAPNALGITKFSKSIIAVFAILSGVLISSNYTNYKSAVYVKNFNVRVKSAINSAINENNYSRENFKKMRCQMSAERCKRAAKIIENNAQRLVPE